MIREKNEKDRRKLVVSNSLGLICQKSRNYKFIKTIFFLFNSQFVASPKCQWILNEIIYYEWPGWRDKSRLTKLAWFFFQLLLVAVSSVFYIPIRLVRKFYRCCNNEKIWEFRELYEHPYSKFINHTMWYLVFLSMIFLTSFDDKFESSATGLIWCGKCHKFNFHLH